MQTPYWQKLKDPRWQKKRLEALSAAEFTCESCQDDTTTLHVHHKAYFKGREPWEYDVGQLAVLCEGCHAAGHSKDDLYALIGSYLPLDGPASRRDAAFLVYGFTGDAPFPDPFHEGLSRRPEWGSFADKLVYLGVLARILREILMGVAYGDDDILHLAEMIQRDPAPFRRLVVETLERHAFNDAAGDAQA